MHPRSNFTIRSQLFVRLSKQPFVAVGTTGATCKIPVVTLPKSPASLLSYSLLLRPLFPGSNVSEIGGPVKVPASYLHRLISNTQNLLELIKRRALFLTVSRDCLSDIITEL